MEILRNFISISGIASPDELPNNVGGQLIQYSDSETVFIPKNHPEIVSLYQILIKIELKSTRSIPTQYGYTVVIDGIKKLKIIYTQGESNGKANFIDLELPFNTFIEQPGYADIENISIHVLDAYFSLLDDRKIYSHYVFMIYVPEASFGTAKTSDILKDICTQSLEEAVLIDLDTD